MGNAVLENIYSDPQSYTKKLDTARSPTTGDLEEEQKSVDTLEEIDNPEEHVLNAALAKLELAEEK